ncbi:MAG: hypothetical protein HW387_1087 [Parachlamydiales bacterium]|nr:hypothetical protein [Parachlamydiales bacterium]
MKDLRSKELVDKILKGEIDSLSDQDQAILIENREEIIKRLDAFFLKQIPCLLDNQVKPALEDKTSLFVRDPDSEEKLATVAAKKILLVPPNENCLDPAALVGGLNLAAFLEASELFPWLRKICHVSHESIEQSLLEEFISEEFAFLLADTMGQWDLLKSEIEDPAVEDFFRGACLCALALALAKGRINRNEVVDYFKSLFCRILSGELAEGMLPTYLVDSCSNFWPGECLEEIRELFGSNLVDESLVDISDVLKKFMMGKEWCIEEMRDEIETHSFCQKLQESKESSDPVQSEKLDNIISRLIEHAQITADQFFQKPERNEICSCGSGRKYKKCCMNKRPSDKLPAKIRVEESVISYGPLEQSDAWKAIPETERESILDLHDLLSKNPEKVIEAAPVYISKYPDIPMLHNFLYGAYRHLKRPREAMAVLTQTLKVFPDYFFGRIEYAHYLVRRGEPEKAHAILENAGTLSQLYPDRKIFHAAEWKGFSYVMSLCYIQKGDLNQAKVYLQILQELAPECAEVEDVVKRIKGALFLQALANAPV